MTPNNNDNSTEYVIYCRISSKEESNKQVQSIPDQINHCIKYAEANNLKLKLRPNGKDCRFESKEEIAKQRKSKSKENAKTYEDARKYYIVKEKGSAKEPSLKQRPKRNKIIQLIKKGSIQGVLSYSPDRQARNMVDGGEIIHLAHKGHVDLKYANFSFENNAGGRMMLGVWFVFSKQYSDKLSEDVTRGLKSKVKMGRAMGIPKYGYIINDQQEYEPHETNFHLMKEAFKMKIYDRKSNAYIAERLTKNGFTRFIKSGKELRGVSSSKLAAIWSDTVYFGINRYGLEEADLREKSDSYEPIISEEEYDILTKIHVNNKIRLGRNKNNLDLEYPLPAGFIVTKDGYNFSPYVTKKGERLKKLEKEKVLQNNQDLTLEDVIKTSQLRYEVKTKLSKYHKLALNFDKIDASIARKLSKLQFSDAIYKEYKIAMKSIEKEQDRKRYEKQRVLELQIGRIKAERDDFYQITMGEKNEAQKILFDKKVDGFHKQIDYLEGERDDLESQKRSRIVEYEMFIEILQNAGSNYLESKYVRKRKIVEIFFSNGVIDNQKRLNLVVKPGLEFLFQKVMSCGAEHETRTRNIHLGKVVH